MKRNTRRFFIALSLIVALLIAQCGGALALTPMLTPAPPSDDVPTGTLILPGNTLYIRDEAFRGDTSIDYAELPYGVKTIGKLAFAYCGTLRIIIPETVNSIASDAFAGTDVTIVSKAGTTAQSYANSAGLSWENIDGSQDEQSYAITPLMGSDMTYIEGTAGYSDNEGANRLLDGTNSTKWCVEMSRSPYIIFSIANSAALSGYVLVSGNDCSVCKGRNPYTWALYGSASAPSGRNASSWKLIDRRVNDATMRDVNWHAYKFKLQQVSTAYRYFKLEIEENQGSESFQLSELALITTTSQPGTANLIYTPVSGTAGVSDNEGFDRLIDGTAGTKWCVKADGATAHAIWQTSRALKLTGYKLITGDDSASFSDRNPTTWRLYGANSSQAPGVNDSKWKLIDSHSGDSSLPAANYQDVTFTLSAQAPAYNCFKLVVEDASNAGTFQIGELVLLAGDAIDETFYPTPTGSSPSGGDTPPGRTPVSERCPQCGGDGKTMCLQCDGRGHMRSDGSKCSACGGTGEKRCSLCNGTGNWVH